MADLFNQDFILPGAITEIVSDYSSGYDTSDFGTTEAEIVIGTAFDGPVGKVVPVYNPEHAQYVFGPSYDASSKREATLVAGVKDAYERGCRTIYAVRPSGKPIYKDYQFCVDTNLKLRVSGFFPSNANKDIYMTFDNTPDDLRLKIYKSSSRATIDEKLQGLVQSDNSIMVSDLSLTQSYGKTRDSKLVDLIHIVNEYKPNNVVKLSIVDSDGVDLTDQSIEAQSLTIGALFPGLYTIGRDQSLCAVSTILDYVIATDSNKPYDTFNGLVFKKLTTNTDVSVDLPIYGSLKDLNAKFGTAGIQMITMFDILEIQGQIDYLFAKDNVDYEEVDCKGFDLYKKLGAGFATTAKAVYKNAIVGKAKLKAGITSRYIDLISGVKLSPIQPEVNITIGMNIYKLAADAIAVDSIIELYDAKGVLVNGVGATVGTILAAINTSGKGQDVRVIESPVSDQNRIMALNDGIYPMLENVTAKYRVLTNGTADEAIVGKLPKKEDFKCRVSLDMGALNNKVVVKAKLNPEEKTTFKKYKFRVVDNIVNSVDVELGLYNNFIAKEVSVYTVNGSIDALKKNGSLTVAYKNGSLFLAKKYDTANATYFADTFELYKYYNGNFIVQNNGTIFADLVDKYFFGNGTLYKGVINSSLVEFKPVNTKASISVTAFDYIMVETLGTVYIYKVSEIAGKLDFVPIGEISEALSEDTDKTIAVVQSAYLQDNVITINTNEADYTTLGDLIDILNADERLASMFSFDVNALEVASKDLYVSELGVVIDEFDSKVAYTKDSLVVYLGTLYKAINDTTDGAFNAPDWSSVAEVAQEDSDVQYNTSLYIPFKTTDTFDRHLAQHCTYTSLKTAPTHGVIGVTKVRDVGNLNAIANKVNDILKMQHRISAKKPNGNDMLDKNNMPYMIGKNISVVVGQYIVTTLDNYNFISNGAAGYAGFVSQLSLDQSSTAQPISIPTPMYEFTNYQLEKLTQAGFVTFRNSYSKGYVVTDGITQAESTSVYRRLSVTKIINALDEQIRAAVEPFLGKENHLANRNAMYTAIKSRLDKMVGTYLQSVDFSLRTDKAAEKLGIIYIDYSTLPVYEIRQVKNSIKIKEQ